jgi:hypothetical protein
MSEMNPLCRTCQFNELRTYTVAGMKVEARDCAKHVAGFPEMIVCRDWQREVGSDDE